MDDDAKKTALRMIPYGLYVLTSRNAGGDVAAATINWVTQTSFAPPMVAVGVKPDSGAYAMIKDSGSFALNMLGKGHQGQAFTFFKPAELADGKVSGEAFSDGTTGSPVLDCAIAHVECKVASIVEQGDHHVVVGEVVGAGVAQAPEGRPDAAILTLPDLGDSIFYGG